jgi:hypothetical protein
MDRPRSRRGAKESYGLHDQKGRLAINRTMSELDPWLGFVLAVLATWRITHLLAREDGPASVLARFRVRLGSGFFGSLMDCFYCLSVWVAAPIALVVSQKPLDWFLALLGLSGAACLLERLGQEPVLIQPVSQPGEREENHGMLRPTTDANQKRNETSDPTGDRSAGA